MRDAKSIGEDAGVEAMGRDAVKTGDGSGEIGRGPWARPYLG